MTEHPYGSWPSPIHAADVARGGVRLDSARFVGDQIWWSEGIAAEDGREAVVREPAPVPADDETAEGQAPVETAEGPAARDREVVLPAPWNARSRVHEYGGTSWTVLPGGDLVFVEFTDQRLYRLAPGADPVALTPDLGISEAAGGPVLRFAVPQPCRDGAEVLAICEDHTATGADGGATIVRSVVTIPTDGSAAADPALVTRVTPEARFTAAPALGPGGDQLAWITWGHPRMPWDGTELWVADLAVGGTVTPRRVAGGPEESVLQPAWLTATELVYLSDRSGWWNLYVHDLETDRDRALHAADEEWADAMWGLGMEWYEILDSTTLLVTHGANPERLGVLDIDTGLVTDLDVPFTAFDGLSTRGARTVSIAAGPDRPAAVVEIPLARPRDLRTVRSSLGAAPESAALPEPAALVAEGPGGRPVHAILWRPRLDGVTAPAGEKPPYVAFVHGGPTAMSTGTLSLKTAYYTSRGIGVVVVNYGGSTGYGRTYRNRLRGQWGVVDVEDTVAVMDHLVAEGIADPQRLGIEGGSAGGWTTLAALTRTDRFTAGVSSFGVAELAEFVKETHDFESRYIDGLVGPLPGSEDLYAERAPLNHVDELECPVLLLQGDEDRIVPPAQSQRFADALATKGIPHRYVLYPGEQHGFRKAENIQDSLEKSLAFYGSVWGFATDAPEIELTRGG